MAWWERTRHQDLTWDTTRAQSKHKVFFLQLSVAQFAIFCVLNLLLLLFVKKMATVLFLNVFFVCHAQFFTMTRKIMLFFIAFFFAHAFFCVFCFFLLLFSSACGNMANVVFTQNVLKNPCKCTKTRAPIFSPIVFCCWLFWIINNGVCLLVFFVCLRFCRCLQRLHRLDHFRWRVRVGFFNFFDHVSPLVIPTFSRACFAVANFFGADPVHVSFFCFFCVDGKYKEFQQFQCLTCTVVVRGLVVSKVTRHVLK